MPRPTGKPCTVLGPKFQGNFVWVWVCWGPALLRMRVEEWRDGRDGDDVPKDAEGVLARKVDLELVSQITTKGSKDDAG